MTEAGLRNLTLLLAAATPLLAWILWQTMEHVAESSGEPSPPGRRRNILILAAAGPAVLGLWYVFNLWLDGVGYRSVFGYVLAALVFLVGGWISGFFGRQAQRFRKKSGPKRPTEP